MHFTCHAVHFPQIAANYVEWDENIFPDMMSGYEVRDPRHHAEKAIYDAFSKGATDA